MWSLIFKAAVSYIEKHPEVVEQLVGQLAQAGISALAKHNAAKAAA